uniref:Uncharacterized protein n=1 Tax=Aegilops tauschii subsp. strangulata TaxID=200361 RepID=A0A453DPV0_AEGTS
MMISSVRSSCSSRLCRPRSTAPPPSASIGDASPRILSSSAVSAPSIGKTLAHGMKVNCEGVPMWLFWKIVDMHNILGISPHVKRNRGRLLGYDEDSNVIFLYMHGSVYMVKLK